MKHSLIFKLVLICDSTISPHLYIATKGQRSRVCEKLFLSKVIPLVVKGVHRDPNAIAGQQFTLGAIYFKHMSGDAGW